MEVTGQPVIEPTRISHVDGENFSGRSAYLQSLIKSADDESSRLPSGVMVGSMTASYISGLAPTVADEIALHISGINGDYEHRLRQLLSDFSFERHSRENPFNLSGGEQALLIIICALLLEPKQLAIDTTLEQLNSTWRTPLLAALSDPVFYATNISIADNRFAEYSLKARTYRPHRHTTAGDENFSSIICPPDIPSATVAKNLVLDNLSFGYTKKQPLLQGMSYEFEAGSIYHISGMNGAGKSTFSKVLAGVLRPSSGNIYMGNSLYHAYRFPGKAVGYSFQNPDEQLFSNTIREEIIPKALLKANKNTAFAERVMSAFGLSRLAHKHPSEMPFVIRKRIALAATIANEREWYIFDEPTIGQDQRNIAETAKLIKLLAQNGKGIILVSHSEQFIASFEHVKTVALKNGGIN